GGEGAGNATGMKAHVGVLIQARLNRAEGSVTEIAARVAAWSSIRVVRHSLKRVEQMEECVWLTAVVQRSRQQHRRAALEHAALGEVARKIGAVHGELLNDVTTVAGDKRPRLDLF